MASRERGRTVAAVSPQGGPRTLVELRRYVAQDRSAAGNPAWLNPAVLVPMTFRISQLLWRRGLRPPAKLIEWLLVMTASSQLSAAAEVGPGLRLPHPVGIVLGARVQLGRDVTLGQNVTLGTNFKRRLGDRLQPDVHDRVFISAGAVVVGPITVGAEAVIGANAVVTVDVPPGAAVRAARSEIIADRRSTSAGALGSETATE